MKSKIFNSIEVETTSICNRKCIYCPNHFYKRPQKFMKEEIFYKIINDLEDIQFSGRFSPHFYGEPLLDKRLLEFLRYTRNKLPRASIQLFTNGDFLTKNLFHSLMNIGVNKIRISQHDENLSSHLQTLLKSILNSSLEDKIVVVKYFENKKVLMNRGGLIATDLVPQDKKHCDYVEKMTITFEGNVILCCNDYFGEYSFGNVQNEHIKAIWTKKNYLEIRKKILKNQWILPICQKCTLPLYT